MPLVNYPHLLRFFSFLFFFCLVHLTSPFALPKSSFGSRKQERACPLPCLHTSKPFFACTGTCSRTQSRGLSTGPCGSLAQRPSDKSLSKTVTKTHSKLPPFLQSARCGRLVETKEYQSVRLSQMSPPHIHASTHPHCLLLPTPTHMHTCTHDTCTHLFQRAQLKAL